MLSGIDHVVLVVRDVDESISWYTDQFAVTVERYELWEAGASPFVSLRVSDSFLIDLLPGEPSGINVDHIALGALLHDIGKAKVDESILSSPEGLSTEQEEVVYSHPAEGARAILRAGGPDHYLASVIAFEHHMGLAGSGYPVIPGGPAPHPASRLVAVADSYDALTTRRPYRRAETPARAQVILRRGAGSDFDPTMVDLLHQVLGVHPVGSVLRLDDGALALVHVTSRDRTGPVQCLLVRGPDGAELADPEPMEVDQRRIIDQLPAETVDIQPSAFLDLLD